MSKKYIYDSVDPVHISLAELPEHQAHLLSNSKTFCIYPWVHLHTYPTGETYPCCHADMQEPVGTTKKHTLADLWNSEKMMELRTNMINDKPSSVCNGCYEQEASGFFSGRKSANKHHGHHIARVDNTTPTGYLEQFNLTYWDTRFSNLCNLSCRTCGHIFSSSWYKDQAMLSGPEWKNTHTALNFAGKTKKDMYEQLMEHIDYVEQIYFAGGEPLMMDEHYLILDELEKRKRFDVKLVYNTNFTVTQLKDRDVFSYWKKFESVSIGASLDGEGKHAEYIRKGTNWNEVEMNRRRMMKDCPNADFYISATLSIFNALHICDFHKDWVNKGLINPGDFNINILQNPSRYRIDIAPQEYKDKIRKKFKEHIKWLEGKDSLNRAVTGFKSALNFLDGDNSSYLRDFIDTTDEVDIIRDEIYVDFVPELKEILNNEKL